MRSPSSLWAGRAPRRSGKIIRPIVHIVNACTRAAGESPLATILREGTVAGLGNHTLLFARDGSECPIDGSGAPIRNQHDAVIGVV